MLKNAFLSIKKNIGKTVLLFVIMTVIDYCRFVNPECFEKINGAN